MFRNFMISLLLLIAAALAACTGAAASSSPAAPAPEPVEVQVKLSEFKIEPSISTFKTGVPYHFVVINEGTVAHELMIMAPMDMNAAATMDMEELDEMALGVIEEDDLQPGATATLDFTFSELAPMGTLQFSCHTPGHYAGGMKMPIAVQ